MQNVGKRKENVGIEIIWRSEVINVSLVMGLVIDPRVLNLEASRTSKDSSCHELEDLSSYKANI